MRVILFGATGPTGLLTIEKLLQQNHEVVIYARDPSKVSFTHPNLSFVEGELSNHSAIAKAIQGTDAVISILGPKGKSTRDLPIAQGLKNIVAGMKQNYVKRIIATATPSAADPMDRFQFSFWCAVVMVKALMKSAYDEIVSISHTVRDSELDWTLVRLPMLTDKPQAKMLHAGYTGDGTTNLFWLSRNDLARFLVAQLNDRSFIQKAPLLSNSMSVAGKMYAKTFKE
jgi:nucleoside-diphosphate-sugar epimerase